MVLVGTVQLVPAKVDPESFPVVLETTGSICIQNETLTCCATGENCLRLGYSRLMASSEVATKTFGEY